MNVNKNRLSVLAVSLVWSIISMALSSVMFSNIGGPLTCGTATFKFLVGPICSFLSDYSWELNRLAIVSFTFFVILLADILLTNIRWVYYWVAAWAIYMIVINNSPFSDFNTSMPILILFTVLLVKGIKWLKVLKAQKKKE